VATDRRRGRRTLTDEERALWRRVTATTDRGAGPEPGGVAPPSTGRKPETDEDAPAVRPEGRTVRPAPRMNGSTARIALKGSEVAPVGRPEAGLDRRTAIRLRKGAREPDARIDLHGMSAERAHRACLVFLADALARGCRVVLVITGKGRDPDDPLARGRGVIRESLPGWLRAAPLGRSIVGIYQAHQRHGGAGAYYVYLKRQR
jgi:DNA-nicking Smr family endonuclease